MIAAKLNVSRFSLAIVVSVPDISEHQCLQYECGLSMFTEHSYGTFRLCLTLQHIIQCIGTHSVLAIAVLDGYFPIL